MKDEPNLYARLGVPLDATTREIRRAYREAARRLHPDTNSDPGETELFLRIQQAYEIISDTKKRREYDSTLPKATVEKPPVEFRIHYSRPDLPLLNETQLIYILVELIAPAETGQEAVPAINSCLVVDSSTSMQGLLMDSVKATAIEIVRSLQAQDMFGLVAFHDNAQVLAPGGIKLDRSYIETAIQMLKPQGGTEIYKGLFAGLEEIKKCRRSGYINHLVLLTDGNTYGDEEKCLRLAHQASDEGITISTLGIGSKWNDDFLDNLATITGGSCTYVAKPKDIDRFMKEKFHSMSKSFASQVTLNVEFDPCVELNYAFRLAPDASPLSRELPAEMGPIPKGGLLSFLLELAVKQFDQALEVLPLADARLTLDIPMRLVPFYNIRFDIELPISRENNIAAPPVEIVQALSRLTLYRMQERVQEELHAGRIQEAASSMKFLATNLLARGENDLAHTVMKEASALEQNSKLSEEGKKKIKYGTRSLVLSHFDNIDDRLKKNETESLE
jgi:Ca-activated chloride channel family protein